MALPLPKPKALLADKGYDGDRFRENLLMRGILPIIPPRSNRKAPEHPDYRRYKDRNRVERMFGKLKQQRRRTPMAEIFCQHGLNPTRPNRACRFIRILILARR
jgi:transposase